MPDFEVGIAIEARFGGDEHYYSGVIQAVYENGTYDIAYDDGDQENGVPHSLVRVRDVDGTEAKAAGVALNSSEANSPEKSGGIAVTSASLSPSDTVVTSALANLPASSVHGGVEMSTTVPSSPPIVVDLGGKPPRIPLGGGSLSADEYDDEFVQDDDDGDSVSWEASAAAATYSRPQSAVAASRPASATPVSARVSRPPSASAGQGGPMMGTVGQAIERIEVAPPSITLVRNQTTQAAGRAASSSPAKSSTSSYSQSSDSADEIDGEDDNEVASRNNDGRNINKLQGVSTVPLKDNSQTAADQNAAALSALLKEKDIESAKAEALAARQSSSSSAATAATAPANVPVSSSASSSMVSAGLSKSHLHRPSLSGSYRSYQRPPNNNNNNIAESRNNSTASRAAAMAAACAARAAEAEALMDPVAVFYAEPFPPPLRAVYADDLIHDPFELNRTGVEWPFVHRREQPGAPHFVCHVQVPRNPHAASFLDPSSAAGSNTADRRAVDRIRERTGRLREAAKGARAQVETTWQERGTVALHKAVAQALADQARRHEQERHAVVQQLRTKAGRLEDTMRFSPKVLDLVAKESAALSQSRRACRPAKALGGLLIPSDGERQYQRSKMKSSGPGSAFGVSSSSPTAGAMKNEAFGTSSSPSSPTHATASGSMYQQQLQHPLVMLGRESKREAESAKARSLELAKLADTMRKSWDEPKQDADLQRREKMAVQQLMQRQAHEVTVVLEKGRLERGRVAAARDASLKALDARVEGSLRALEHAARLDGRLRRCRTSTGPEGLAASSSAARSDIIMVGLSHHCLQAISDAQVFPFESHFFHDHHQEQQQRSRPRNVKKKSNKNRTGASNARAHFQSSEGIGGAGTPLSDASPSHSPPPSPSPSLPSPNTAAAAATATTTAAQSDNGPQPAAAAAAATVYSRHEGSTGQNGDEEDHREGEGAEGGKEKEGVARTIADEAETTTAGTRVAGVQSLRSLRSTSDVVVPARAGATERSPVEGAAAAAAASAAVQQGGHVSSDGLQRPKSAPVLRKVNSGQPLASTLGTKPRSDVLDSAATTALTTLASPGVQQQQEEQQPQQQQQHTHPLSRETPPSSSPFEHELRHIQQKPPLRRPKSACATTRRTAGGNKNNNNIKAKKQYEVHGGGKGGNRSYAEAQAAVRAVGVAELCAWCGCRFKANGYKVQMPRGDLSKSTIAGLPDGSAFCDWPCAKAWNAKYSPPLQRHARDVAIDFGAGYFVAINRYKEECSPVDRQVKAFGIEQRARAQRQAATAATRSAQSLPEDPYLSIVHPRSDGSSNHNPQNDFSGSGFRFETGEALPPRPDLGGLTALKKPMAAALNQGRSLTPARRRTKKGSFNETNDNCELNIGTIMHQGITGIL